MKKVILKDNEIKEILNEYKELNYSQQKIADNHHISRTVLKRILQENEVVFRERTKKYSGNYDIFEIIDSIEKAYWLGFLAADGCNYQRKHNASIIINLSHKDMSHLEKFKLFCDTDAKIVNYQTKHEGYSNNNLMSKIILNSKKMSNDLIDKGVVPKKSLILKKPNIPSEYYLPFILGYFDGDGSISKSSQYNNYSISLEGTKEILDWIQETLGTNQKLEKRNNDNKNNYYIRCGGTKKPYLILKQLYNSCDIHLDRKYNIYKDLETVVLNRNIK